jgi:hypothetical protein
MKKFFLILSLVFLSSCTLPWQSQPDAIPVEHTFQNDYERHVRAVFDQVNTTLNSYLDLSEKLSPSGYDDSTIRFAWDIAGTASGELKIHADAARNTREMLMSAMIDASGFFSADGSTLRLDAFKGAVTTRMASYLFRLDAFQISGTGSEYESIKEGFDTMMLKMQPHLGKWLEYNALAPMQMLSSGTDASTNQISLISLGVYFDLLSGGDKLESILSKQAPIRVTSVLGKDGDYYQYAVELDQTGAYTLVDTLSRTFAGTGVIDSEKTQKELQAISLSGILSIHESRPEFAKFDGILSASGVPIQAHIDTAFTPESSHIRIFQRGSGSTETLMFDYDGKSTDTTGAYKLSLSGSQIATLNTTRDTKGITGFDLDFTPEGEWVKIQYDYSDREKFAMKVSTVQSDEVSEIITASWIFHDGNFSHIDAILSPPDVSSIQLQYDYTSDGTITGKISSESFPWALELTGHAKKDDVELVGSFQGIQATLAYKKSPDGILEWSLKLPVATITWKGKESKEFFESFSLNMVSPVATALLDMQTVDGWLTGPLKVSQNGQKDAFQINLKAKRSGKDFSWRLDVPVSAMNEHALHLEWDSHIDIRYDKDAKVQLPSESTSIFDAFPELKNTFIPDDTVIQSNNTVDEDKIFSDFSDI